MILSETVAEKFKALLSLSEQWKSIVESQFVKHLSTFVGWCVENAEYKIERARQEAFIDTALNRSSILAHGEGMEYTPIKPIPASGKVKITNMGEYAFSLPIGTVLQDDAQNEYTTQDAIAVEPAESVEVAVKQTAKESYSFTVDTEKSFYEILLDKDISKQVVSFEVWVSTDAGKTYTQWTYSRLFINANSTDTVYDEFYHFTDQIGIRFGNGQFGKIIPEGSLVRVDVILTNGDTTLLEKQNLYLTEDITDASGEAANAEIVVSETIQNGSDQEDTETMRRNLHYAQLYNERLIWETDYRFFIKRTCPDVVWSAAWGEETAEQMWGYDVKNINRIWVCAYSPKRSVQEPIMTALKGVSFLCRNQVWYEPELVYFRVNITGKVLKDANLTEVKTAITDTLTNLYGAASLNRRDSVLLHEVYEAIYATGYFDHDTGAWFEVTLDGTFSAVLVYQMVCIDLDNSTIDITYLYE